MSTSDWSEEKKKEVEGKFIKFFVEQPASQGKEPNFKKRKNSPFQCVYMWTKTGGVAIATICKSRKSD